MRVRTRAAFQSRHSCLSARIAFEDDIPVFFRAPPRRAGPFWHCPKGAKRLGAGGGGFGNFLSPRLPLPLADRAPVRTPPSMASNMRAFPARSAARLRHRQRRRFSLRHRPSMAYCNVHRNIIRHGTRARMRAKRGPSNTASGGRKCPKDGAQEVRQFAAGTRMCLRRTPAVASEPEAHGSAEGGFAGWPSLW